MKKFFVLALIALVSMMSCNSKSNTVTENTGTTYKSDFDRCDESIPGSIYMVVTYNGNDADTVYYRKPDPTVGEVIGYEKTNGSIMEPVYQKTVYIELPKDTNPVYVQDTACACTTVYVKLAV